MADDQRLHPFEWIPLSLEQTQRLGDQLHALLARDTAQAHNDPPRARRQRCAELSPARRCSTKALDINAVGDDHNTVGWHACALDELAAQVARAGDERVTQPMLQPLVAQLMAGVDAAMRANQPRLRWHEGSRRTGEQIRVIILRLHDLRAQAPCLRDDLARRLQLVACAPAQIERRDRYTRLTQLRQKMRAMCRHLVKDQHVWLEAAPVEPTDQLYELRLDTASDQ